MKKYNFSKSLQEIIEQAEAEAAGCRAIMPVHLLKALLIHPDDKTSYWFKIHNIDMKLLLKCVNQALEELQCDDKETDISSVTREVLRLSGIIAIQSSEEDVRPLHLLMALLDEPDNIVEAVFEAAGVELSSLEDIIYIEEMKRAYEEEKSVMMKYGVNLNMVLEKGTYVPVTAKWHVIDEIMEILCRTYKNIPVTVGGKGMDKSMLAEGVAYRILKGEGGEALRGHYVIHVMTDLIIGDSQDINGFIAILRQIIEEANQYNNLILYFDELYPDFYDSGTLNLPSLLKPILKRGRIKIMGSSGKEGLAIVVDKDSYVRSRVHILKIKDFSQKKILSILERFARRIGSEHVIGISDHAVRHAYENVKEFLNREEPIEETYNLIDMAATRRVLSFKGQGVPKLRPADIDVITAETAAIPLWRVSGDEKEYACMENRMASMVAGQKSQIKEIADIMRLKENKFNLEPELPNGVFLFVGPRGVGKKTMISAMADMLYDDSSRITYLDMENFSEPETILELMGYSDPSKNERYPSFLTDRISRYPHSILFLEEIDKASPNVRDLFSDIFKTGRFQDSFGNRISFRGITVVMTVKAYEDRKKQMGFIPSSGADFDRAAVHESMEGILKHEMMGAVDGVIIFNELKRNVIKEIIAENLQEELEEKMNINWDVENDVLEFLTDEIMATSDKLRSMNRLFQVHIFSFLAEQYYSKDIKHRSGITLQYSKERGMELK